jgi:hypothetical protein
MVTEKGCLLLHDMETTFVPETTWKSFFGLGAVVFKRFLECF